MTKAEKLFDEIKDLKPHERLALAAGLLEKGRPVTAYLVARATVDELGTWLALHPELAT